MHEDRMHIKGRSTSLFTEFQKPYPPIALYSTLCQNGEHHTPQPAFAIVKRLRDIRNPHEISYFPGTAADPLKLFPGR
jgi:hypothetical protein